MLKKVTISFLTIIIASISVVYGVKAALPMVTAGQTLTAASWNAVVANVNQLGSGTASVGQNGFVFLPGGLIMAWGRVGTGANNSVPTNFSVTFPGTFPHAIFNVQATPSEEVSLNNQLMVQIMSKTSSGFTGRIVNSGNTAAPADYVYWTAIGN